MSESAVETTSVNKAEAAGWFVRKITYPNRRGALDRLFLKDGRYVWIEFKRPGKTELDALQGREADRLEAHGAEVHRGVNSVAHAMRILGLS